MASPLPTLLCLGDSHTYGQYGVDWVGTLQCSVAGKLAVVRSGVNGHWAQQIGARLAPLLATHPHPAGVVILAGTNDVLASTGPVSLQAYQRLFPELRGQAASLEGYLSAVDAMLSHLQAAAPDAKVALLTLPPVGEDLTDDVNARVVQYNASISDLAARYGSVRLVDFHAACVRHLDALPSGRPAPPPSPFAAGRGGGGLLGMVLLSAATMARRYALRMSWDAIAALSNMHILTDHVHLSDTAGRLLLQELQPWVDELLAAGAPQPPSK